jgi:transcriptional regulator GlxA family with amidase domain
MKKIAIIVPESAVVQAIADPLYCFEVVNHFLESRNKEPLFDIKLVGRSQPVMQAAGFFSVHPNATITDTEVYDLVFVPALFGNIREAIAANQPFIPWLQKQFEHGAEIASLCLGAFLLAATGLLEGKKCSTHWAFAHDFETMFPKVNMQAGSIVTEEGGLYSSGGANSYWNLLVHIVEKYAGREMAILVAKYFAVDIDRNCQATFAIFKGQKKHGDEVVQQAQLLIEQHLDDRLTVEEIADRIAIGRRSLERRFKQATHNSILEYMQRVKMEAAKRRFETSKKNINEVMYDVGYNDTKAFRSTFKKITGLTPHAYRKKYNPDVKSHAN